MATALQTVPSSAVHCISLDDIGLVIYTYLSGLPTTLTSLQFTPITTMSTIQLQQHLPTTPMKLLCAWMTIPAHHWGPFGFQSTISTWRSTEEWLVLWWLYSGWVLLVFFEGFNNIDSHTTTLTTNHITTYFFYPNSVTPRVQTLVTTMPSYTTLYTMWWAHFPPPCFHQTLPPTILQPREINPTTKFFPPKSNVDIESWGFLWLQQHRCQENVFKVLSVKHAIRRWRFLVQLNITSTWKITIHIQQTTWTFTHLCDLWKFPVNFSFLPYH